MFVDEIKVLLTNDKGVLGSWQPLLCSLKGHLNYSLQDWSLCLLREHELPFNTKRSYDSHHKAYLVKMHRLILTALIVSIFFGSAFGQTLLNRDIIFESIDQISESERKMIFNVCLTRKGKVSKAVYQQESSKISNNTLISVSKNEIQKWKFEASENTRKCGFINYDSNEARKKFQDLNKSIGDSLFCSITEKYVGLNPQLYLDHDSLTIINYDPKFPKYINSYILQSKDINASPFKEDSLAGINVEKEFQEFVKGFEKVNLDDFQTVTLDSLSNKENPNELYSYKHDFIGDERLDEVVIYKNDKSVYKHAAYSLSLYENGNRNLELKNCGCGLYEKPLQIHIPDFNVNGMNTILFFIESDIPDESKKIQMINFDRYEHRTY